MENFSKDRVVNLNDLEDLLNRICTENFYIKADEYRRLIGLGKTQFNFLKQSGALDGGIHPATKNSRRILIHRYYSYKLRTIVWFPKEQITLNRGGKNMGKKALNPRNALQQQELSKHSPQPLEQSRRHNMEKIHKSTGSPASAGIPEVPQHNHLEVNDETTV